MKSYSSRIVRLGQGQYVSRCSLCALFAAIVAALAAPPALADAVVYPPVKPKAVTINPSDMPPVTPADLIKKYKGKEP